MISSAFGCPFEGEVPVSRVVDIARQVMAAGPAELGIADSIGVAVPAQVTAWSRRFGRRIGERSRCAFICTTRATPGWPMPRRRSMPVPHRWMRASAASAVVRLPRLPPATCQPTTCSTCCRARASKPAFHSTRSSTQVAGSRPSSAAACRRCCRKPGRFRPRHEPSQDIHHINFLFADLDAAVARFEALFGDGAFVWKTSQARAYARRGHASATPGWCWSHRSTGRGYRTGAVPARTRRRVFSCCRSASRPRPGDRRAGSADSSVQPGDVRAGPCRVADCRPARDTVPGVAMTVDRTPSENPPDRHRAAGRFPVCFGLREGKSRPGNRRRARATEESPGSIGQGAR